MHDANCAVAAPIHQCIKFSKIPIPHPTSSYAGRRILCYRAWGRATLCNCMASGAIWTLFYWLLDEQPGRLETRQAVRDWCLSQRSSGSTAVLPARHQFTLATSWGIIHMDNPPATSQGHQRDTVPKRCRASTGSLANCVTEMESLKYPLLPRGKPNGCPDPVCLLAVQTGVWGVASQLQQNELPWTATRPDRPDRRCPPHF